MLDLHYKGGEENVNGQPAHDSDVKEQARMDDTHPSDEDALTEDAWEIRVTTEMKRKLARQWQTSIILKLMGRQLGYHALQTKLAGIWRPIGTMHLIDIGYGFFIMHFELLKDYHHALTDGPWFMGD